MKQALHMGLCLLLLLFASCKKEDIIHTTTIQPTFDFKWTKTLKGPSDEDEIDAVAADKEGNVFVSGKFEDSLTIDGQNESIYSNGMADIMVVKYDKDGHWKWTKQFGGTKEDNIFDAACDNQGNVILSGYFQGTVQFGPYTLTSQGGFDMVLVKMNTVGTVLWAKQFGGNGHDGGNEIEVGVDNRILVGAQSNGTFEGIPNTGGQDAYLLALDEHGNTIWIQAIKGSGDARAKAISIDRLGNAYVGGDFIHSNYIENGGSPIQLQAFGNRDAYLVCFNSNGTYQWSKTWGSDGVDFCKGIVTTSQNELYAIGQFQKTVHFNSNVLTSVNDSKDLFVWKMDKSGDTKWLRHIASSEKLSGTEVAIDDEDHLVFGLGITGATNFQISQTDFVTISGCGGLRCPVLIKYDKSGERIDYISASQSYDGRFGELAVRNNIVYIDCEINGGSYTFDNAEITTTNNTKDAAIVAIAL